MDSFLSHSQHADDYIAWQLLGKKKNGLVIEVGAFDGIHLSNSYSFSQMGWKSICVEPNPEIFKYLQTNRPNAINLNIALVGDDSIEEIDFFAEDLGVLSGCLLDEEDLKRRYSNRGLNYKRPKKIKVKTTTLDQVLTNHNCESVDILSIDVEGFELEVLKGLDLKTNDVKLLIIEANNDTIKGEIIVFLSQYKDYMFAGNNYQNLFFLKRNVLSKKILRQIDYKNYVKAKQIHPKGEKYYLDSVSPIFSESKEFKKYKKYFNFF